LGDNFFVFWVKVAASSHSQDSRLKADQKMVTAAGLWEVNQNPAAHFSVHSISRFFILKIKNGKRSGYKK